MHIASLSLSNFRNYVQQTLALENGAVILTGHNGAGKTNILEAISFLIPGRGLRRSSLSDIDREANGLGWGVVAEIHSNEGFAATINTGREAHSANPQSEKRTVKIDGKVAKSQHVLSRYVSMLWMIPAMDGLFLESDSAKRRFLDRLVFAFDEEHAERVARYEHAMRERSRLLAENSYDPAWVSVLEQNMAELGVAMAVARRETVAHLNAAIEASELSFPKAQVRLASFVDGLLEQQLPAVEIEQQAKERLEQMRSADKASGRCVFGLHRCEMHTRYLLRGVDASQCSTGEQKALLLSILLGQARAIKHIKGISPIVLLDEVVAHLDSGRRGELADTITELGLQAWLTGTDASFFETFHHRAQRIHVSYGTIVQDHKNPVLI